MSFGKNRQWTAVLYNENMRPDWKEEVDSLLQLPFAYCVHDKGLTLEDGDHRKVHTHFILVFSAPTTYNHACEVFSSLNETGKKAFNTIEPVYSARRCYDYLIHDTEDCRKKGKYQFEASERVTGNNYDIGAYEQISQADKNEAFDILTNEAINGGFQTLGDFIECIQATHAEEWELYRDVLRSWNGYFDKICKSNYLKQVNAVAFERAVEAKVKSVLKKSDL